MKRRDLLKKGAASALAVGAAAVAGCAAGGPASQGTGAPAITTGRQVRWRLASSFPRSLDTLFGGAEHLARRVADLTGGAFEIRVHPAGELVPGLQVLDAVQQGSVQAGQSASYYYTGKNPALAFDACVPFGLTARQQEAWLREAGGRGLMDQLFADFSVLSFSAGNTGTQMGGWFKREVETLADLRGLKMRIPGMGGEVMARLGVAVQVLAGGEIFQALERGAIDATEWVGPHDDEKLGFHEVASLYYYPGWWEPGPSLSFYVSRAAWDDLPATYREIFRAAADEAGIAMTARYDTLNPPALTRLLAAGVQLRPFSPEIMEAAGEASRQLLVDRAAAEPSFRRVFEHWEAFRRESVRWFGTAELAYARHAFGR